MVEENKDKWRKKILSKGWKVIIMKLMGKQLKTRNIVMMVMNIQRLQH